MTAHRQGPVRSETARVAVLDATAELFAERGYERLTIEGVATAAGVSKQTIYRWWPSKGALVSACLLEGKLFPNRFTLPDTGDVRRDLRSWLGELFSLMAQAQGQLIVRSLIAASVENADIGMRLRERLGASRSLTERLQLGIDAGQLRDGAPLEEIGDSLIGAVLLRALSRTETDDASIDRLVIAVIGPDTPSVGSGRT